MTRKGDTRLGAALLVLGTLFLSGLFVALFSSGRQAQSEQAKVLAQAVTLTATRRPTRSPTPTATRRVTRTPTQPPATLTPIPPSPTVTPIALSLPFGPQGIPPELFAAYSGTFLSLAPETALTTLEQARANHLRLTVQLAGSRPAYQTATGAFSIVGFRTALDRWSGVNLQPYIDDGTIIGHMLFDEPHDGSNWDGLPVPLADIKLATAYSKQLWPTLPVGLGTNACYLSLGGIDDHLDFVSTSFSARGLNRVNTCGLSYPTAATWLAAQVAGTSQLSLKLVISINPLAADNTAPNMTAADLQAFGVLFAAEPRVCLITMWRYETLASDADGDDVNYWLLPGVPAAVDAIKAAAAGRSACQPLGPGV